MYVVGKICDGNTKGHNPGGYKFPQPGGRGSKEGSNGKGGCS